MMATDDDDNDDGAATAATATARGTTPTAQDYNSATTVDTPPQNLAVSVASFHEGWLKKQRAGKHWPGAKQTDRWFELSGTTLSWYLEQPPAGGDGLEVPKPLGSVETSGCIVVPAGEKCFSVAFVSGREDLFIADSADGAEQWIAALSGDLDVNMNRLLALLAQQEEDAVNTATAADPKLRRSITDIAAVVRSGIETKDHTVAPSRHGGVGGATAAGKDGLALLLDELWRQYDVDNDGQLSLAEVEALTIKFVKSELEVGLPRKLVAHARLLLEKGCLAVSAADDVQYGALCTMVDSIIPTIQPGIDSIVQDLSSALLRFRNDHGNTTDVPQETAALAGCQAARRRGN